MSSSPYIIEERRPSPKTGKAYEGLMAQGSGYLHVRATYEEGLAAAPQDEEYMRLPANVTLEKPRHPRSKAGTYIPGITGQHPLLNEEGINLPNPLCFTPQVAGEDYDLDRSRTEDYLRTLDMASGELVRSFLWRTRSGAAIRCRYRRTVSRQQPNLVVQEMAYRIEEGSGTLKLRAGIDASVRTNGWNHFAKTSSQAALNTQTVKVTTDTGYAVVMRTLLTGPADFRPRGSALEAVCRFRPGDELVFHKLTAVTDSTRPAADLGAQLRRGAKDPAALFAESAAAWGRLWEKAAVTIEGDRSAAEAQRAVLFSIYHLLRCGSPGGERAAICAKGFAGEAYYGHFFWDSELYLLPFFLNTWPAAGKSLVDFRLHTLPGARRNAAALGYPGARYPWESSPGGREQCSNFQYADHEIHVTADVVFGLWHYYCATGDGRTLKRALPMLADTARYWLARIEERPRRKGPARLSALTLKPLPKDAPEVGLKGVMGPDEYICLCDNEIYTNTLVAYTLDKTADLLERAGRTSPSPAEIRRIASLLPVRRGPGGVLMQCDHFEDFQEPDFATFWRDRSRPYGCAVSQERNYRTKALKQAAAVMLPYLFPSRYARRDQERLLDYYLPYTTHDSSLSYAVHAIVAARLGRAEQALELFRKALRIDTDPASGGAAEGIHIANAGGLWQALVYGFAGLLPAYEEKAGAELPVFRPHLPPGWKSLSFNMQRRGRSLKVTVAGGLVRIESKK